MAEKASRENFLFAWREKIKSFEVCDVVGEGQGGSYNLLALPGDPEGPNNQLQALSAAPTAA